MEKLFLISGLGADRRLFDKIQLPGYEFIHVDWIESEQNDSITTYAKKLIETYHITPGSSIIGVSLGGILTVEISSMIPLHKAVIISSIKSINEIPWYFALFRRLPVYKILPIGFYTSMGALIKPLFEQMTRQEWALFKSMLAGTSPRFMKWAMHAVLRWQPKPLSCKIHHIIGTRDFIFSHKNICDADHIIQGGTHDMAYKKGEQVSAILQSILKNETA
ncbi:alpha/beta hydrolase [Mucilaginibacter sp. Bleaf8]|uniref:alpha/beta hydrolase n=1 Tax=Mucilaginibacter sp. Bleaf8 TaxID=2834430 RepID=UPI001BD16D1A|nr:alpha/beta hydrolase [Mucilaginibacter sp. Bleaf8]MBS7563301.1 alpha/beta hydrolase [Mucilaginibacter sp. Bleaf8]